MAGARLAGLCTDTRSKLIQLHSPALAAGAPFPVPAVAVHHSCVATWWSAVKPGERLPADFHWRTELTAQGLSAADAVIAPTAAFAEAVAATYGLRDVPATVHNGRSLPPVPTSQRTEAPARFVLASGRLWDEGKNIAALDRAAARIAAPVLAAGPLRAPHGGSVELRHARPLGALCEPVMQRWLADAPVYASLALYEPFGLGVLEAAQAGCALVLSDAPTFRELWNGAALFVPPHDDAAIAGALDSVLWDDALRDQMARTARERSSRYTVERMAVGMAAHYGRLLGRELAGAFTQDLDGPRGRRKIGGRSRTGGDGIAA
jgi:glycosyltransferase involved in cell wall biosynthesis